MMKVSNNSYLPNYYTKSKTRLSKLNKFELVNIFNKETTCRAWVGARGAFQKALIQCLIESKVDISIVGDKHQISWKYPVYLDQNNVLRQIN